MGNTEVSGLLGIDRQAAAQVPGRFARMVFFDELAKLGISPADDNQAIALLDASDQLEAKRAAFQAATDPVNRSLNLLLGKKQAATPQRQPAADVRNDAHRKVAEFLTDPYAYGAVLVNLFEPVN